eukprot:jgi/Chlat1/3511/Chrsp23S03793
MPSNGALTAAGGAGGGPSRPLERKLSGGGLPRTPRTPRTLRTPRTPRGTPTRGPFSPSQRAGGLRDFSSASSSRSLAPWSLLALALLLALLTAAAAARKYALPGLTLARVRELRLHPQADSAAAAASFNRASSLRALQAEASSSSNSNDNASKSAADESKLPLSSPSAPTGDSLAAQLRQQQQGQRLTFQLIVLTCDRPASLGRLLSSLASAHYDGDIVHLKIMVDYCKCLLLARALAWPHGHKSVHARLANGGLRTAWLDAWLPGKGEDGRAAAIILEDDMDVSDLYYKFAKKVLGEYYLHQFDPKMVGFCLMPSFVPNMKPHRFFRSNSTCSWAPVMLPEAWREFVLWVDERLDDPNYKPLLPEDAKLTFTSPQEVNLWVRNDRDVWSPLFYAYILSHNRYTVNYGHKGAFAVNHLEKGSNYGFKRNPDMPLGDPIEMQFMMGIAESLPALQSLDWC